MTNSVSIVAVTMPPIMGAAMRFMPPAPVPWDHMMGSKHKMIAEVVMILGRIYFRSIPSCDTIKCTRQPIRGPFQRKDGIC